MTEANAVLAAISEITGKIGSVKKGGRNAFHNYDYATAADILHKLQPLLAEAGLVIISTQKELRFLDDQQALLAIDYEFSLYHKSGAVHPDRPVLTGMASAKNSKGGLDDKAANKCLTAATKYFLLNLFKIPTGDYDDADADDDKPSKADTGKVWGDPAITPAQVKVLQTAIVEVGADLPRFLKVLGIENLSDLPAAQYQNALDKLMAKRAKEAAGA